MLASLMKSLNYGKKEKGIAPGSIFIEPSTPAKVALRSLILGGTGQIDLGQKKKGAVLIAGSIVGLALFIIPGVIVIGLSVYDALVMRRRQLEGRELGDWEFFWHKLEETPANWKVVSKTRCGFTEEPIGVETMRIDNSTSDSTTMRSLRVTREWSRHYSVEYEHIVTTTDVIDPKLTESSLIRHSVEDLRRKQYNDTQGNTQTVEETIEIEVPAGRNVRIELHWKNIFDNWTMLLRNDDGDEAVVPFNIVSKVTFDQRMENVVDPALVG